MDVHRDVGKHLVIAELVKFRNLDDTVQNQHPPESFGVVDFEELKCSPLLEEFPLDLDSEFGSGIERSFFEKPVVT
jgi:hypothetical protein